VFAERARCQVDCRRVESGKMVAVIKLVEFSKRKQCHYPSKKKSKGEEAASDPRRGVDSKEKQVERSSRIPEFPEVSLFR
jgi:hypothetical protein